MHIRNIFIVKKPNEVVCSTHTYKNQHNLGSLNSHYI